MHVQDLMTTDVVTVHPNEDLNMVYDLMDGRRIRHVPVLDGNDELVGIVSQRDLLRGALGPAVHLPLSAQRELLRERTVSSIMMTEPLTAEPSWSLRDAGQVLLEHKLGCLPVIEGDHLVGILTESDFVRFAVDQF